MEAFEPTADEIIVMNKMGFNSVKELFCSVVAGGVGELQQERATNLQEAFIAAPTEVKEHIAEELNIDPKTLESKGNDADVSDDIAAE